MSGRCSDSPDVQCEGRVSCSRLFCSSCRRCGPRYMARIRGGNGAPGNCPPESIPSQADRRLRAPRLLKQHYDELVGPMRPINAMRHGEILKAPQSDDVTHPALRGIGPSHVDDEGSQGLCDLSYFPQHYEHILAPTQFAHFAARARRWKCLIVFCS